MTGSSVTPLRYIDAGVDVEAADATVLQFAAIAKRTMRPEVLSGVGRSLDYSMFQKGTVTQYWLRALMELALSYSLRQPLIDMTRLVQIW